MNISVAQFDRISTHFPVQRGNVKTENLIFLNAILYMAENGCKWRALPKEFGKGQTVYKRFNRWAKNGVMQRIFAVLQMEKIIEIDVKILALDSTSYKVLLDAHGVLKNLGNRLSESPEVAGIPSFMWYPQMTKSSLKSTCPAQNAMMHQKGESQ